MDKVQKPLILKSEKNGQLGRKSEEGRQKERLLKMKERETKIIRMKDREHVCCTETEYAHIVT
jgi:hypothetical protein